MDSIINARIGKINLIPGLTMDEKALVVNAILMQALTYHLCIAELPKTFLDKLSARVRAKIRQFRTPGSFPTELLHRAREHGGWGLKDLDVEDLTLTLQLWLDILGQAEWSAPYVHRIAWKYLSTSSAVKVVFKGDYWEIHPADPLPAAGGSVGHQLATTLKRLNWVIKGEGRPLWGMEKFTVGHIVHIAGRDYKVSDFTGEGAQNAHLYGRSPIHPTE